VPLPIPPVSLPQNDRIENMGILETFRTAAQERGLLRPDEALDPATVFRLVRDMPYRRANSRQPETIIAEWQGTCSGKHYLLQALFAELGFTARVMACTTAAPVKPDHIPAEVQPLYEAANRRFVDVHNYLLLDLPQGGSMIVDATWPLRAEEDSLPANAEFELGRDQTLLVEPIETWEIPAGVDPQAFKEDLLQQHFSPAELHFREIIIQFLGDKT
jgi:hypothetical protein